MSVRPPAARPLALAALAAAVIGGAVGGAPAAHGALGDDCDRILSHARGASVEVGLVVLDLASGERCETGAETVFRSASLYKLVVMAEVYEQIAAGALARDQIIELLTRHYVDVPETEPEETVSISVEDAIGEMIRWSDNPTAVALHELLADADVADHARRLGMEQTVLAPRYVTTPGDIARFFERLHEGTVVSAAASAEMYALLRDQRIRRLLPQGLPQGVPIAHKTGSLAEWEHDAGIVEAPGGDYVVVVLTRHGGDFPAAYATIRELSALVYAGFADPVTAAAAGAAAPPATPVPAPAPASAPEPDRPAAAGAAPQPEPDRPPAAETAPQPEPDRPPAAETAPQPEPDRPPAAGAAPAPEPARPAAGPPPGAGPGAAWWQRPGGRALLVALAGVLPAASLLAAARRRRAG